MTRQTFILRAAPHPARKNAVQAVLAAPEGYSVVIAEPRKSRDQEAKYHAMFTDVARQVPVNGIHVDEVTMKRVLVSAFKIDTKDDPDLREAWMQVADAPMLVGLRGEIVIVGDQTRKFPKPLASAFIEWLYALGAEHDVQWTEPKAEAATAL